MATASATNNADTEERQYTEGEIVLIPLSELDLDSFTNVRKKIDAAGTEELANDIEQNGLLHSPSARPKSEATIQAQEEKTATGDPSKEFEVTIGFRRMKALQLLYEKNGSYELVPVRVTYAPDDVILLQQISENIKRENLTVDETFDAIERLMAPKEEGGLGLTRKEVTAKLGVKDAWLKQRLSFAQHAHPDLKKSVDSGDVPFTQAYNVFTALGGADTSSTLRKLKSEKPTSEADKTKLKEVSKRWKLQGDAVQAMQTKLEAVREQFKKKGEKPSPKQEAKARNQGIKGALSQLTKKVSFLASDGQNLIVEVHKKTKELEDLESLRQESAYALGVRDLIMQLMGSSDAFDVFAYFGTALTPVKEMRLPGEANPKGGTAAVGQKASKKAKSAPKKLVPKKAAANNGASSEESSEAAGEAGVETASTKAKKAPGKKATASKK